MAHVRTVFSSLVFTLMLLVTAGTVQAETEQGGPSGGTAPGDLIDVARQAGNFSTFLHALEQADILEDMKGDGPYTVFAPTDEAFANMPRQQRERLFSPDNVDDLKTMLHYHMVPGLIAAKEAGAVDHVQALTQQIYIKKQGDQLMVNDAHVVVPEMKANNGILYGIDKVMMPHFQEVFSSHPESSQ